MSFGMIGHVDRLTLKWKHYTLKHLHMLQELFIPHTLS
jgi:hypothetical protein